MRSPEETFALAPAKLEEARLSNALEPYDAKSYLNDDFQLNVDDAHASTKVYHVIQKIWAEGSVEIFIKNNVLHNKLEVKDLVAFDSARFVKLVLEVLAFELIEEKEAWGLLFLNASRIQDAFSDEKDFIKAYFKGMLYYEILFKSEEEDRGDKIENFDALLRALTKNNQVKITWLKENIFTSFHLNKSKPNTKTKPIAHKTKMYQLLAQQNKTALWQLLDGFSQEERNLHLPKLYLDKKNNPILNDEDYLELPALYAQVSYAHYLRGVYFYHFAWEARGLGITNTVGQKNYALFYERLRYAKADLKKAYELKPEEQTYWAELYNLVKHFRSDEADQLEAELYEKITQNAMQNPYCIERVAHLKKARWGGSHKESLAWAREVVAGVPYGDTLKIILLESLIEQHLYILEFDKDEKRANAVFQSPELQEEVNACFEELLEHATTSSNIAKILRFWYEKVDDMRRLKKIRT